MGRGNSPHYLICIFICPSLHIVKNWSSLPWCWKKKSTNWSDASRLTSGGQNYKIRQVLEFKLVFETWGMQSKSNESLTWALHLNTKRVLKSLYRSFFHKVIQLAFNSSQGGNLTARGLWPPMATANRRAVPGEPAAEFSLPCNTVQRPSRKRFINQITGNSWWIFFLNQTTNMFGNSINWLCALTSFPLYFSIWSTVFFCVWLC